MRDYEEQLLNFKATAIVGFILIGIVGLLWLFHLI